MIRIDGTQIAAETIDKVKSETRRLIETKGVTPGLAVVIVGSDPASQVYVASKGRMARECGLNSYEHALPEDTSREDLLALVDQLNKDDNVHGILVQMPLPDHLDDMEIIQTINPDKDVDGLTEINVGRLVSGNLDRAFVPCTPSGCMVMIRRVLGNDLSGKNATVIGRSILVGKPIANLLLHANATVTMAHSRTADLPEVCRSADILVAAVGRPQMVKGDWIKPGATVIDVGINRIPAPERGEGKTRLVGDVDYNAAAEVAHAVTPVPKGVGPMTIAMLMANTIRAAFIMAGEPAPEF